MRAPIDGRPRRTQMVECGNEAQGITLGGSPCGSQHHAVYSLMLLLDDGLLAFPEEDPPRHRDQGQRTVFEVGAALTGGGGDRGSACVVREQSLRRSGRTGQKVTIPPGAEHVDLSGKTVIPGIVDAHGHPGFVDAVTGKLAKDELNPPRTSSITGALYAIRTSWRPSATATTWASSPTAARPKPSRTRRSSQPRARALSGVPAQPMISRNDVCIRAHP